MSPPIPPHINSTTSWKHTQLTNHGTQVSDCSALEAALNSTSSLCYNPFNISPVMGNYQGGINGPVLLPQALHSAPFKVGLGNNLISYQLPTTNSSNLSVSPIPISQSTLTNQLHPLLPATDPLLLQQLQIQNQFSFLLGTPGSLLPSLPITSESTNNQQATINSQSYEGVGTYMPEATRIEIPYIPLQPQPNEENLAAAVSIEPTVTATVKNQTSPEIDRKRCSTPPGIPCCSPTHLTPPPTEALNDLPTPKPKRDKPFVMGQLSNDTYYPTHFMRGTMIRLSNGTLRQVENLSTDDFLAVASKTSELLIEPARFARCTKSKNHVKIYLELENNEETAIDVQLEYPLFVLGKGWCSVEPERTLETYGLEAKHVRHGDVCITMRKKKEEQPFDVVVPIAEAQRLNQKEMRLAKWRDELEVEMMDITDELYRHGRASAPPRMEKLRQSHDSV